MIIVVNIIKMYSSALCKKSVSEFVLQLDSSEFWTLWNMFVCVAQLHQDLAVVGVNLESRLIVRQSI